MTFEGFDKGNQVYSSAKLARILAANGETAEAEKLLIPGITYLEENRIFGLGRAEAHRLMGDVYLTAHKGAEAARQFHAALSVLDQHQGLNFGEKAASWLGLARALALIDKYDDALSAADQSRRLLHEMTTKVLPVLPEPEQLAFLTTEDEPAFQQTLALIGDHADPATARLAASWILNRKGLAQQAVAQRVLLSREATDPAIAGLVQDWVAVRNRLAKVSISGGAGAAASQTSPQLIAELTRREQNLASELGRANVQGAGAQPWCDVDQLRQALSPATVYVDLVRYAPPTDSKRAVYLAWIVPPAGKGNVQRIDLGSAEQIEQAIQEVRRELGVAPSYLNGLESKESVIAAETRLRVALTRLSELLLKPLLPAISAFEYWVISPDGAPLVGAVERSVAARRERTAGTVRR